MSEHDHHDPIRSPAVRRVSERLERFRAERRAPATPTAPLVDEARQLFAAFQEAEAQHVKLGLAGRLPFAEAQDELRRCRLAFSNAINELRLERAGGLGSRLVDELARLETLATRAPLTGPDELELIRRERAGRRCR